MFKVGLAQDFLVQGIQGSLQGLLAKDDTAFATGFTRVVDILRLSENSTLVANGTRVDAVSSSVPVEKKRRFCTELIRSDEFLDLCLYRPTLLAHLTPSFPINIEERPEEHKSFAQCGKRASRVSRTHIEAELGQMIGESRLVVDHGTGDGTNLLALSRRYPNHCFLGTEIMPTYRSLLVQQAFKDRLGQLGANAALHVFGTYEDQDCPSIAGAHLQLVPFNHFMKRHMETGAHRTFPSGRMAQWPTERREAFLNHLRDLKNDLLERRLFQVVGEGTRDAVLNLYPSGDPDLEDQLSPVKRRVDLALKWLKPGGKTLFLMEDPLCFAAMLGSMINHPATASVVFSEFPLTLNSLKGLGITPYEVNRFDVLRETGSNRWAPFGKFTWGFPVIVEKSLRA